MENITYNEVIEEEDDEVEEDELEHSGEVDREEPPAKREKPEWNGCGLPTRNYEEQVFGKPSLDRSNCFGCTVIAERAMAPIPFPRMNELFEMIRQSVAYTDPVNLAVNVEKKYNEIRQEINDALPEDRIPLPYWPAAMILDHLRNHNTDPEMQTWLRLIEIQELMQIALKASVEVTSAGIDPETGEEIYFQRIDSKQQKCYLDLAKAWLQLARTDFKKLPFTSTGAVVDLHGPGSATISTKRKTIYDFFEPIRDVQEPDPFEF